MIYWLCPKPDSPSGGVWFIHHLAELLDDNGIPSRVVQLQRFQVDWDATPIRHDLIWDASVHPVSGGILVVPEVNWPYVNSDAERQIMFVQNRIWLTKELQNYAEKPETLVCSRYLANYMERVHAIKPIGKLTPFLAEGVWGPTPKHTNRTLVVARRNPYYPKMIALLAENDFPVTIIDHPVTQRELAAALADCEFYVHLVHPEGFPMACLEAMRMGTIVCGTTGGGGTEFMFHRETAYVVQDPDSGHYANGNQFVQNVMEGLKALAADADMRSRIWQNGWNWSKRYTAENTLKELQEIFK